MLQWWNCKDLGQPENGGQDDHHKVDNIYNVYKLSWLLFYYYVSWNDWKCDHFRSVLTYSRIGGHVKTLTFCQGSHYLAVASDNGSIQLLAVEANISRPNHPKSSPVRPGVCKSCNSTCSILNLCAAYNGTNEQWIKTITLSQSDQWATESLSGSWTQRMRAVRWTYITLTQGHRRFWPMPLWMAFWWVGISAAIAMPGPSAMTCALVSSLPLLWTCTSVGCVWVRELDSCIVKQTCADQNSNYRRMFSGNSYTIIVFIRFALSRFDLFYVLLNTGTSNGTMACWDMRFQLPISSHSHPARARIRHLLMHPLYQSSVIAGKTSRMITMLHLFD